MYQQLLTIIFAASVVVAVPTTLPRNFKTCSRNDPNIGECLKPAVQSAIRDLIKGSRPVGVLPIDPLQISTLEIHQGTGPVAVNLDFSDLAILGIGKVIVHNIDAQLSGDTKKLTVSVSTPDAFTLVGKYTINGKVLILPIAGTGNSKIDFERTKVDITFTGKTVKKEGVAYLVFNSVELDMVPSRMVVGFENLFNGDKALGDNMNKFLNENWAEVYSELKSAIEKALATTFIEITNRIFTKVAYDSIFTQ